MRRPRLVNDWHRCWRWFSMQLMASAAAIQVTVLSLPKEWQDKYVPESVMHGLVLALIAGAGLGRVVDQNKEPPRVDSSH